MESIVFLIRKQGIKDVLIFVCLTCKKVDQTKSKQNLL